LLKKLNFFHVRFHGSGCLGPVIPSFICLLGEYDRGAAKPDPPVVKPYEENIGTGIMKIKKPGMNVWLK